MVRVGALSPSSPSGEPWWLRVITSSARLIRIVNPVINRSVGSAYQRGLQA
ncbi:hypothetical protein LYNGBM3L_54310 [Moorena producens 3L]|uniref:Uncharacterized protein n=1 Tax=Moorena producens 3L TaxID=489825 RepID=F4XQQ3_9CYAN|nr:hypothetical protein LYNGBM3L_54310 [Moorena producens 3L]